MDMNELVFHDATIQPQEYDRGMEVKTMPSPYSPGISFGEDQLPDVKDWQTGEEYILVLKVRQNGSNLIGPEGDKKLRADFDILEVAGYSEADSEDSGEKD